MRNKRPIWRHTYDFIKALGTHYGFGVLAKHNGITEQTAQAWAREPESDENPNGSGKKNNLDATLRNIALAHNFNPGIAREMADMFPAYVDHLDEKAGIKHRKTGGCALELLSQSAKEHADILIALVQDKGDRSKVWTEYKQFEAVMRQFGACLKEELKEETMRGGESQNLRMVA